MHFQHMQSVSANSDHCYIMCEFCSTFVRRASNAIPLGFSLFVIAWVMLLVVAFGFPYKAGSGLDGIIAFSIFPWCILGKGLQDLAYASTGKLTKTHIFGIYLLCIQIHNHYILQL